MLVIKRKQGESLLIGEDIEITIISAENGSVKIAIDAPRNVTILRKELYKEIGEENKSAANVDTTILKSLKKK